MKYWLLFVSAILFIPNLSSRHLIYLPDKPLKNERFKADFARKIQSTSQLVTYIDSIAAVKRIKTNTNTYADLILETVENRFFHSYSHYSLDENWISALSGRYIWYNISAIVDADDILKYPMAACSQQSIVLMGIFKSKHIPYRKVGFDGHYAVAAEFNKQWIFLDADYEPQSDHNMRRLNYLLKGNNFAEFYKDVLTPAQINIVFKHIVVGGINAEPAPRIGAFHVITRFLSHWLWALPMSLFLLLTLKNYKNKLSNPVERSVFTGSTALNLQYTFQAFTETSHHSYNEKADKS